MFHKNAAILHCRARHRFSWMTAAGPVPHPPEKNKTQHRQAGFTIIELVTVLLLISIVTVTAIAKWPHATISLAAQAEQLAGDIRYVQMLSMTHGQRFRINFAADHYWISDRDGGTVIANPATNNSNIYLNRGITLRASQSFIVFDGLGAPYSSASLPGTALSSNATITLSASGATQSIQLSPETGRVALL